VPAQKGILPTQSLDIGRVARAFKPLEHLRPVGALGSQDLQRDLLVLDRSPAQLGEVRATSAPLQASDATSIRFPRKEEEFSKRWATHALRSSSATI
jgi:hypothetical protein